MIASYNNFLAIETQAITGPDVDSFVVRVGEIVIGFPQHRPIAKGYFTNETRLVYKILFAGIVYIVDTSDQDALIFLLQSNTTQQEFQGLEQIRADIQISGARSTRRYPKSAR